MSSCSHRRRPCLSCGNCPRCSECVCNGPKRGRGRPPRQPTPSRPHPRIASSMAARRIKQAVKQDLDSDEAKKNTTKDSGRCLEDSIPSLFVALGIPKYETRLLPSADKRESLFQDLNLKEQTRMHELMDKCIYAVCLRFLPCSPGALYRSYREEHTGDALLKGAIVDGIKSSKKGSLEGKTLKALLCSCLPASEVYSLLSSKKGGTEHCPLKVGVIDVAENSPPAATPASERRDMGEESETNIEVRDCATSDMDEVTPDPFRCRVTGCVIDKSGDTGTATGHNCSKCNAPVHSICCQRVLRITVIGEEDCLFCSVCYTITDKTPILESPVVESSATKRKRDFVEEDAPGHPKKSRSGAAAYAYQRARKDWDFLLSDGRVPQVIHTRKRCSDESIRKAVQYLFRPENVQLLSWGTKRIRLDGKWVDFPAIMRKATCAKIFRLYEEKLSTMRNDVTQEAGKILGRSSFLLVAATLTRGQQKRKTAVDYVLGTLVYDNIRCARDLVTGEVDGPDKRAQLLCQLDAVEEFLKFTYLEHIDIDNDPLHDSTFALETSQSLGSTGTTRTSNCKLCMIPFQVICNIEDSLSDDKQDLHTVLEEVKRKISLYMGHQMRCYNQEQRIANIFMDLRKNTSEQKVVILIDYKMKFEAIRFREKTTEFFGKKGMSWHGAVVFYYNSTESSTHSASSAAGQEDEIRTLFFDHLLTNDMKQDRVAVLSLLDAILARLKIELPDVKRFHLISDNARCYQNDLLPVMGPFIAKSHSLFMEGFVHSETQRGKSLVDAHFALAMMHISRYCTETRKDVTTPADVVEALNSFGGVANCTAEMVHLRRDYPVLRHWLTAESEGRLSKLGRVNEFVYSNWEGNEVTMKCYALSGREFFTYSIGKIFCRPASVVSMRHQQPATVEVEHVRQDDGTPDGDSYLSIVNPEEVSFRSNITGVSVWARSRLRRNQRKRAKKGKPADVLQETESQLRAQVDSIQDSESEEECPGPIMLRCGRCGKSYRREDAFKKHELVCPGGQKSENVLARAVRMATAMLGTPDAPIHNTKDNHPAVTGINIGEAAVQASERRLGWAQRPAYGQTLGANTVERFAADLLCWFHAGQVDKAKKMSASRMRELLQKKYPSRYDLPGEHFINAFIQAQVRKHKRNVSAFVISEVEEVTDPAGKRRGVAKIYADKLVELLTENRSLMPRQANTALIHAMGLNEDALPDDFPPENALKNKVAAIRALLRRQSSI